MDNEQTAKTSEQMSKTALERLKELEDKHNAIQRENAEVSRKHQERLQHVKTAKDDFWKTVVTVAIWQAEHDLKKDGWKIEPAHVSQQSRDETAILVSLPRKEWKVTLVFMWPSDTECKMRGHWGRPDPQVGGSYETFVIGKSTVEDVKREILEMVVKMTDQGTRANR